MVTGRAWGPRRWVGAVTGERTGCVGFQATLEVEKPSRERKSVVRPQEEKQAPVSGQTGTDVGKTFQIDQGQAGKPCEYS